MKLISHRGNINGKELDKENNPLYIKDILFNEYDVEIDVWKINNELFLGHDNSQYLINKNFIYNNRTKLWCHAKNYEAFEWLLINRLKCFWHTTEDYVLTNYGDVWVYPGKKLFRDCIAVLPEQTNYSKEELSQCKAICSDFIGIYK